MWIHAFSKGIVWKEQRLLQLEFELKLLILFSVLSNHSTNSAPPPVIGHFSGLLWSVLMPFCIDMFLPICRVSLAFFSINILNLFLEIFISELKLVPELLSKKLFLLEMIEYLGNSLDLVTIWIQLDCIWEEETLPPHHQADTCWEKYLKIVAGIKEIAI